MLLDVLLVLAGMAALYFGGEWLVNGAEKLALSFGVSVLIISLTVVAIGTSMPELLVSLQGALGGSSDLAIGNVIGSNIANIGLILGATALLSPLLIQASLLRREIPLMILFTLLVIGMAADGALSRVDGFFLLLAYLLFTVAFYFFAKRDAATAEQLTAEVGEQPTDSSRPRDFARLLLGIAALALGSRLMVAGAVSLARSVGISELVIATTLVAFGTSLPELATSLSAVRQNVTDVAIGNVIGSNIANLLLILGIVALVTPIPVDGAEVQLEFLVMFGFAIALLPFLFNQRLGRKRAALLLGAYIAFVLFSVASGRQPPLVQ